MKFFKTNIVLLGEAKTGTAESDCRHQHHQSPEQHSLRLLF